MHYRYSFQQLHKQQNSWNENFGDTSWKPYTIKVGIVPAAIQTLINTPTSKKINIDGMPAEILLIIPFSIVDQEIFFKNPNANKRTIPNKIGMCGETSN